MAFEPLNLNKPRNRLRRSADTVTAMAVTRNYKEFEDLWERFLTDCNAFFDLLHVVTKSNQRARAWYGEKHRQRRNDPLLKYLWEARNSNEHSVADTTELVPSSYMIGIPGPGRSSSISISGTIGGPNENFTITSLDGLPVHSIIQPSYAALLPVTARDKTIYPPPTSHLGNKLSDTTPRNVARLAVVYMDGTLAEAAAFRS